MRHNMRIATALAAILTAVSVSSFAGLFETPLERATRESSARDWAVAREVQIERKRAFSEQIAKARARFWETYPDKPGAEEAQRQFEDLLREKDSYYLQAALYGRFVDISPEVDIDGGIREYASFEFNTWVKAARDSGAGSKSPLPGQLMDAFTVGVTINAWEYKAYARERNWSEFDTMHRLPAGFDKPETYGGYLYFRYRFTQLPKNDPRAKSPGENAAATFDKMVEVFGKQLVFDAAKKVMDAPKSDKGNLPITVPRPVKKGPGGSEVEDYDVPMPDGVIGVYASPLTALELLVVKDDDRRYLLWVLSGLDPLQINTSGTDPATAWTFADGLYRRLVIAFGEKDVLQAAHAIRIAKKRMIDYTVMDPAAIGATRASVWTSFEDVLARRNPAGYVRAMLMFQRNAQLRTAAEVDAANRKFLSENAEGKALEAAGQLAAERPNLIGPDELARLKQVLDGSLAFKKPPSPDTLVDFPAYVDWKRFKPGAKISHATRYWKQDRLSNQMPVRSNRLIPQMQDHQAWQLQSINDEKAKLWFTQSSYDMFGHAKPAGDSEVSYPARYVPPAQPRPPANAPAPTSNAAWGATRTPAPVESGDEVVEVNGKRIATRWQSAAYGYDANGTDKDCALAVKVWTSDEVPTGLIRRVEDKSCPPATGSPYGIRFVAETFLESFDGFTPATPDPSRPVATAYAPLPVAPNAGTSPATAPTSPPPAAKPAQASVPAQPAAVPPRRVPLQPVPPRMATPAGLPPEAAAQFEIAQRYNQALFRAQRDKRALMQLQQSQSGAPLPDDVRAARDRLDDQVKSSLMAMSRRDNAQASQALQSTEASLTVIEKYLEP